MGVVFSEEILRKVFFAAYNCGIGFFPEFMFNGAANRDR